MNTRPAYRPDIDGLRAVAILVILAFHAFPAAVPGGFVGVDVFFVISGFLISSILFAELRAGTFRFRTFYARRVRRLFPALLSVLAAVLAVGWFVLVPAEYASVGKHTAAGMAFIANFTLLEETEYFATAAELKPLLHLWSLGIEEQFYIVWPLILFGLWKWRKGLVPVAGLLFVASFVFSATEALSDPDHAFFLPYSRFWELLCGAALGYAAVFGRGEFGVAAWAARYPALARWRPGEVAPVIGLLLIALAVVLYDKDMAFPGAAALVPVLGAMLLIAAPGGWISRMLLERRVMVWVGLISYPLYLWHWPVISYLHILMGERVTLPMLIGGLGLSVMLAWLTYRYIERPVRSRPAEACLPLLFALALAILAAGYAGHKGWFRPYLDIPALNPLFEAGKDWGIKAVLPKADMDDAIANFDPVRIRGEDVLYIGDSNMEQFLPRLSWVLTEKTDDVYTAVHMTRGGCLPIPNVMRVSRKNLRKCHELMDRITAHLDRHPVKRVVISALWDGMFTGRTKRIYRYEDGRIAFLNQEEGKQAALRSLYDFITGLRARGIDVVVIGSVPSGLAAMDAPTVDRIHLFRVKTYGEELRLMTHFPLAGAIDPVSAPLIEKTAREAGAEWVDPIPYVCPDPSACPLYHDGMRPVYRDKTHISASYARTHATFMDKTILAVD